MVGKFLGTTYLVARFTRARLDNQLSVMPHSSSNRRVSVSARRSSGD